VDHENGSYARLRYTAIGALAAFAAAGAIAGTVALAANPSAKTHRLATVTAGVRSKTPMPGNTATPQPGSGQPFLTAVRELVNNGTITATQGQTLDREILAGRLDTQMLASSGLTATQLQAVEQALVNTKRALAPGTTGAPRAPKEPPPAGTGAPSGGKRPPPAATPSNSAPK
jgi:hypothetical protein